MDKTEVKETYAQKRRRTSKSKEKDENNEQIVQINKKDIDMKTDEKKEEEIIENTETKCENKEEGTVEATPEEKLVSAKEIVKNHMLISAGFGAVPVPMVDLIGLTGTQLNMLKELSAVYGESFTHEIAKKSIVSLAGGTLSVPLSAGLSSLIKSIPVIGQTAGVISVATIGAAATYAVGEVFIKHFQSGGTFMTFDATNFKEYFKEKFSKGKDVVEEIKEEKSTQSNDKKENEVDTKSKA